MFSPFTEVNPDKGTETCPYTTYRILILHYRLQKLTPIRGRKQAFFKCFFKFFAKLTFTEVNPDKGTETLIEVSLPT